ncbi:MAG: threonine synthase, partial [Flavobacteriales bacterium]|nr:threonine synthase [Flavobacteriales bacterium]
MQFSSLSDSNIKRSFAEAVVEGLAPDKGLYFPNRIPELPEEFWLSTEDKNSWDIGAEMLTPYTEGCLTKDELLEILRDVLNFPIPLHEIESGVFSLELFHGPTSAFKDVGARFMSRVLSRISNSRLTILVATSGDTGSAVANGFLGVPNIDVV